MVGFEQNLAGMNRCNCKVNLDSRRNGAVLDYEAGGINCVLYKMWRNKTGSLRTDSAALR